MKNYSNVLFVILLIILPSLGFSNTKDHVTLSQPLYVQDTVEFSLREDFDGNCGNDCYRFISSNVITKINGKPVKKYCTDIFVKCPSDFKFTKGITYRFIAKTFKPNECSTIIDICIQNKQFLLIKEFN